MSVKIFQQFQILGKVSSKQEEWVHTYWVSHIPCLINRCYIRSGKADVNVIEYFVDNNQGGSHQIDVFDRIDVDGGVLPDNVEGVTGRTGLVFAGRRGGRKGGLHYFFLVFSIKTEDY